MTCQTTTTSDSESALTPTLRFPEFRNDREWKPVSLADASDPVEERVGDRKLTPVSISAGIGFVPQAQKFGRDISGNQYKLYTVVRDGDFVYNKGNSLRFPQGCVYQLRDWGEVAAPNVFICFRLKKGFSDGFFQNSFEKNTHGFQLKRHITSGARSNGLLNISRETFFSVKIPTPSLAEQRKIANCLSTLDDLIATEKQKLDAIKAHKNGLMQQLFPEEGETIPHLRFPEFRNVGDWESLPFSKLCDVKHGYAFESEYFSDRGDFVLLTPGNFFEEGGYRDRAGKQKFYTGEIPRDYVLKKGDMLVAMTEQAAGLLGSPLIVPDSKLFLHNQRLGLIIPKPSAPWSNDFFFHVFNSRSVRRAIAASASGAKVRHTSPTKIGDIIVAVPPLLAEQLRIAGCLTSLDDLIAAQSDRLDSLRTHRQGLLGQLFPVSFDAIP